MRGAVLLRCSVGRGLPRACQVSPLCAVGQWPIAKRIEPRLESFLVLLEEETLEAVRPQTPVASVRRLHYALEFLQIAIRLGKVADLHHRFFSDLGQWTANDGALKILCLVRLPDFKYGDVNFLTLPFDLYREVRLHVFRRNPVFMHELTRDLLPHLFFLALLHRLSRDVIRNHPLLESKRVSVRGGGYGV
jgi:hypothetical protein